MNIKQNRLIQAVRARFLNLPGEELIFAQRKHWLVFALPVFVLSVFGILSWAGLIVASSLLISYSFLFLPVALFISVFILSVAIRSVINWYYNIYIVTNRKIVEVSYSPLSSHQINEILLDQVKCTEIDTKIEGLINDILDIGHVIITFDRPTHQEEFVFDYMQSPRTIEIYLQKALSRAPPQSMQNGENAPNNIPMALYGKDRNSPGKWTYMEDLKPLSLGGAVN